MRAGDHRRCGYPQPRGAEHPGEGGLAVRVEPLEPPPDDGGALDELGTGEGGGAELDGSVDVDVEDDGCGRSLLVGGADDVALGVAVGLGFGAMPSSSICCLFGSVCSGWPLR